MTLSDVWSCFSTTNDTTPSDAAQYRDVYGVKYSYDTTVPNHKNVKTGDVLVVRDADYVHGFGWVQEVRTAPTTKKMTLCPECKRSGPLRRVRLTPTYSCKCGNEFDAPVFEERAVLAYEAWYDTSWAPFSTAVSRTALETLYVGADRQNAIRRLDSATTATFLHGIGSLLGVAELSEAEASPSPGSSTVTAGGHVPVMGKRRIGQESFRQQLRDRYGDACALSGPQPPDVLDAAHLYLFAENPEHHLDGGLLLRSDLHRLFDAFKLTIDPETWTVRIAPDLMMFEELAHLEQAMVRVPSELRPNPKWLRIHRDEALRRWSL